jgi:hypothetical protein
MGLFGKKGFKDAMKDFAKEIEWELSDVDDESAAFDLETEDGNEHTLYLEYDKETLAFSIPSDFSCDRERDIPDELSTTLLKRNATLETGFWAIEEIEDEWTYILYHSQKLPNQDFDLDLDAKTFQNIVEEMIGEVEEVNELLEDEE